MVSNNIEINLYFILSQGISILTTTIVQFSLVWIVTENYTSAISLSLASIVGFGLQAIISPFAGVIIDRYSRKRIIIAADITEMLVSLSLIVYCLMYNLTLYIIILFIGLKAIGNTFHIIAFQAIIPEVFKKEDISKVNGLIQTISSISYFIGPIIAGLLLKIGTIKEVLIVEVLGAIIAVLFLSVIELRKIEIETDKSKTKFFNEIKDGIDIMKKNKKLYSMIKISSIFILTYISVGTYFPLLTKTHFNGNSVHAGLIESMFAVGMIIGSLAISKWGKSDNNKIIFYSILGMGLSLIITGGLPKGGFYFFLLTSFVMGIAASLFSISFISVIQLNVEEKFLGRVLSLIRSLYLISLPIGLLISGPIAEILKVPVWFFISGSIIVLLFFVSKRKNIFD